jgi:hypothetical protein
MPTTRINAEFFSGHKLCRYFVNVQREHPAIYSVDLGHALVEVTRRSFDDSHRRGHQFCAAAFPNQFGDVHTVRGVFNDVSGGICLFQLSSDFGNVHVIYRIVGAVLWPM